MVVVCRKRRAVWERADGQDRGCSFKINLCRRGSASIGAGSDRQQPTDRVQTATLRTKPRTVPNSPENRLKMIENRQKMDTKSFSDDQGGHNRPWTALGTMLWTPNAHPGHPKSAHGTPRGCQKCSGNASGRAKDVQKRAWRAPQTHLEPIFLGERRPSRS